MKITSNISLKPDEVHIHFIRASGPGGQNVNKVSTAVQLRFNVKNSTSLPEAIRTRLYALASNHINNEGELIIKANRFRTQERNKQDAIHRLAEWIKRAAVIPKKRKKTKPSQASIEKRLSEKKLRGKIKALRRAI